MRIYFDNAATTPIESEVIAAMQEAMQNVYGNPSSIHNEGRIARATIEEARKKVANYLNASIGEIFFTSGGTESNNMALKCAVRDLGVERVITSQIEHHCILHPLEALEKSQGTLVEYVRLDEYGVPDYYHLEELLQDSNYKTMVSLMHSNNEIGSMLDLDRVSDLCTAYKALFHSDTVQTMGFYPIDVDKTKINFLAGASHKFYGPKGVGFIYINGDNNIKPFMEGGSQERNMRGGTENIYGIVGLSKALELMCDNRTSRENHIRSLRAYMHTQLLENFEDIYFNNDFENGIYKLLSVSFPPSPKSDLLLLNLDIAGISASGGSACSSGAEAGSHVLEGMKYAEDRKTIRFSFSHHNTMEEVDFVIEHLKKMVAVKETV